MVTASINGIFSTEPRWDEKTQSGSSPGWGSGWIDIGGGGTFWGGGGGGGENPPEWNDPETVSEPYLRTTANGCLLSSKNYLLHGTSRCPMLPILGQIDGENGKNHCRCLLFRTTWNVRWGVLSSAGNWHFGGYFDWHFPQEMKIWIKWQTGHYDIAKISRIHLVIFGIDIGWVTLALGNDYMEAATVRIDENGVFVNSLKADFTGNLKYLE